jgi:hypothetical protein
VCVPQVVEADGRNVGGGDQSVLPVMAHDFRTRSALHDFMFLSEL